MQAKREREEAEAKRREQEAAGQLDDDEAGEWVTQDNLYTFITHGDTKVLDLIKDTAEDPLAERKPIMDDDDDCAPLDALEDEEQAEEKPVEANKEASEVIETRVIEEKKEEINETDKKIQKAAQGQDTVNAPKKVIFLTSDFAMQNVIIQMGFILLTIDGMRLTRVKRFKLLCRACFRLNMDIEREFCDYCGTHALSKVSVFINEDGKITFFDNPKRRINLRGTIYSIPKAKGGRNNQDLILREDEFMTGERYMKKRQMEKEKRKEAEAIKNTLEGNYWAGGQGYTAGVSNLLYDNGAKGGYSGHRKQPNMTIGHGKKNPNIARRKV